MRDLNQTELAALLEWGKCPFCSGKIFRFGPRGGASLNIFCTGCGAGFNICVPMFPAQLIGEPWKDRSG